MNFLVAKVKKLVAFATVSVAIPSPGLTQTWCILNYDIRLILFGHYGLLIKVRSLRFG